MCLSLNKYCLYGFLVVEKKRQKRKRKKVEVDLTDYVRMHVQNVGRLENSFLHSIFCIDDSYPLSIMGGKKT